MLQNVFKLSAPNLVNMFFMNVTQILTRCQIFYFKNATNSISAGAPPRSRWGAFSAPSLSDPLAGFREGKGKGKLKDRTRKEERKGKREGKGEEKGEGRKEEE